MLGSDRIVFFLLAFAACALLGSGLVLGEWLHLQPCYWCNFQRLLYLVIAMFSLIGALAGRPVRLWSALVLLTALGGVAAAARQSWMQYAPALVTECGFGERSLTEQLVDWLSGIWPYMFMVTGLCKEKDWSFLGLTLANWSGLCFAGLAFVAAWMMFRTPARPVRR